MKSQTRSIIFIVGVVLLCLGALDPMEGSLLILAGSILMTVAGFLNRDRHRKWFLFFSLLILFGVFFLFYLSNFGGFGEGALSWWWSILIIPYPLAWIATVVLLIVRAFKKPKEAEDDLAEMVQQNS